MFKEDGRAYAIGDSPTAGMSSSKQTLPVPSGLFCAYFSVFSNKGRGIEGIGVPPHELVPYDPKELAAGVDTQIRRAEELLEKGFPDGSVAYVPPANR
jgi:carboxyl-terminal processing protease